MNDVEIRSRLGELFLALQDFNASPSDVNSVKCITLILIIADGMKANFKAQQEAAKAEKKLIVDESVRRLTHGSMLRGPQTKN